MKIILIFISTSITFGQFTNVYNGFGLDIGTSGSGFFLTRQLMHDSNHFSLNGEIRYYDIKASNETYVYNNFNGQWESIGGVSLFMLPVFVGGNYFPFNGKIENNFSPFLTFRLGGVLSFDGKEYGSFKDRWEEPDTQITPGGFIGVGVEFKMIGLNSVSVMFGYEILPLKREFDGLDDVCDHFLIYKKQIPVGTARLREKGSGIFKIERVAILKHERLGGFGKLLMEDVINNIINNDNLKMLILHSQVQVKGFYQKLGFKEKGREFLEDNIPHIKMIFDYK